MPDAAELLILLKKTALEAVEASKPMSFFFGKVTGVEPLVIDVEQKMKLKASQLIFSRNVTDFDTEISVDTMTNPALETHTHSLSFRMEESGEPLHIHGLSGNIDAKNLSHAHEIKKRMKITVHNRLAVGDKVILIRNKGGQKYLVVDRIG